MDDGTNEATLDAAIKAARYHSAGFTVYPQLGKIKAGDELLSLSLINMKVLLVLLKSSGGVVSRAELFKRVWGKQIVSDDALTRCISDIRSLLGKYNNETLIETLPKRGYCWLANVTELDDSDEGCSELVVTREQYLSWIIVSIVLVLFIFTTVSWYLSEKKPLPYVQIALIPIQVSNINQQVLATDLEGVLRENLLKTKSLRFLSDRAMNGNLLNPYPYLARELGTQWIIEGQIRQQQDEVRVSLSLVDARSGLVVYATHTEIQGNVLGVDLISAGFIAGITERLSLSNVSD